jgi:hypothetical protein
MENITSGDIIQGARWPEPVQVELVEELNQGAYVRVVGVTRHSRMHVDQLLPRDEVAQLRHARVEVSFAASPRQVFLALETRRYRFAALYDPLLAMNTSKVDPLPHQIEAVYVCWLHEISAEKIESFPLQLSGLLTTDTYRECGLWKCSCHPRRKLTDHDSNISLVRSFHQGK